MKDFGKISVNKAWTGDYHDEHWVALGASGPEGEVVINIPTLKAPALAASLLVSAQEAGKRLKPADVTENAALLLSGLESPIEAIGVQIIKGEHPCLLLNIGVGGLRFKLLPEAFVQLCATVANASKGEPGLM